MTDLGEKHITSVCKTNAMFLGKYVLVLHMVKRIIDPKTLNVGIPPN